MVGKKQLTKSIGAAATPVPINTPSLRSEYKSREPWSSGGASTNLSAIGEKAKLASWAKDESLTTAATATAPERGRSWALGDDDEEESEDDGGKQRDRNIYPERDWGRENYNEEDEPVQPSRGYNDTHRHQSSRYNKVSHHY